jgi:glycosyltransferase involved in cell wall biosynthesis
MQYPRITVVTPNYNQGKFIEQTILSVLNQNYPNLEYIIIDGKSTDESVDIIKKYESQLSYWVSEKDNGQYDAINRGLTRGTGEIMTYINSDDVLAPHSFEFVLEIFSKYKQIDWITGLGARIDDKGRVINVTGYERWNKYRYLAHDYRWIQQEGTFWRKSLWDRAGGFVSTNHNLAGDLELWNRFFKTADLYTVATPLAYFRARGHDQKSVEGINKYFQEADEILNKNSITAYEKKQLNKNKLAALLAKYPILSSLSKKVKSDAGIFPPLVAFDRISQQFVLYNPEK